MQPGNGSSSGTNSNNFDGGTRSGEEIPQTTLVFQPGAPSVLKGPDKF